MPSVSDLNALGNPTDSEQLLARAREIKPIIEQWSAHGNEQRDLAQEIVRAIVDAGLFRLYQPKCWGGLEADPRTLFAIQNVFAESCASTAWVYGVLSVQSFMLGTFDQRAQEDVWGEDATTLASSSFMSEGSVQPCEGGFRISGRGSFSSGSSHARWLMFGGLDPKVRDGHVPLMRWFLLPRGDYTIEDTWHTIGLRATGSNDVVIEDAFVPTYRSFQPEPGIIPTGREDVSVLFRLPWMYIFISSVANLSIGISRAALKAFISIERSRVSRMTGKAGKEDPAVQRVIAQTDSTIHLTISMFDRHIERLSNAVSGGETMSMTEGLLLRSQLTGALRNLATLVDEMQLLLGGRGIYTTSPLTRIWLDMCAARAHPGNDPSAMEASAGKYLLREDI